MKKLICTTILFVFAIISSFAAYQTNIPRTLVQPNGDTLHCFISGDEFYLRIHDADGYTIVQNPSTGYFVYGVKQGDDVVPSPWIAGKVNPAAKGLTPGVCISKEKYLQIRKRMVLPAKREVVRDENTNHGDLNNIAIFIRFADDTIFTRPYSEVQFMFNDSSENYTTNSMFNYFKRTSYNQLFVRTYIYPEADGDTIISYQDAFPRSYFQPWSETNPDGYQEGQWAEREHELLDRACAYVESQIPTNVDFDYNNDGYIDNVVFVIKGNAGDWNSLLWPHRWSLYTKNTYIHGKRVYDYNLQLDGTNGEFNTSVLCHEMFHSLGAPDLYHYYDDSGLVPVGNWDLMAQNQDPPQQTCAYMKYKYGNWLDQEDLIPITQNGTYTLMPLNSETPDRICYRIATEHAYEFILADYRSKQEPFDKTCPNRGVVFYRINTRYDGNAGYDGDDNLDEIYVFRTNGSPTANGNVNGANFRGGIIRQEFSPETNPFPFLSNGEVVPIHITNFTNVVDSIQFDFSEWVSVEDYDENQIIAYPNPAQDHFTIEITKPGNYTYQIYNVQGQLMETITSTEQICTFSIANFPAGYYFLNVREGQNHFKTLKFIKY